MTSNPRLVIGDFSISIQANEYAYCIPRNNEEPHTHYELGFPSESINALVPELLEYCETPSDELNTVWAYVPKELVEKLINLIQDRY